MNEEVDDKEVLLEKIRKLELEKNQIKLAEKGSFFTPWSEVWDIEKSPKKECYGQFDKVCRSTVPDIYKEIVSPLKDISEKKGAASREAGDAPDLGLLLNKVASSREASDSPNDLNILAQNDLSPKSKKSKKGKTKNSVDANTLKPSSSGNSSQSSRQRKSNSYRSPSSSLSFGSLGKPSSIFTGSSASEQSAVSQSDIPCFNGINHSMKAHMIPNILTSECYRYYIAICQAVVGIRSQFKDVARSRLEQVVRRLAELQYNFLRAPLGHGKYYDHHPCWIVVPACSLESILDWKPSDSYPVLAVANSLGGFSVESAYKDMCPLYYDGDDFDAREEERFKRSKCQKIDFQNATNNLRQMTLAMAETLVGEWKGCSPDQYLIDKNIVVANENDYDYIATMLKKKIVGNEDDKTYGEDGQKKSGDEDRTRSGRGKDFSPLQFNRVQFQETKRKFNKEGICIPKEKDGLDFNNVELFQFTVDPESGIDLCPDPLLLLIKAAINWSWYCGQKLLPTCGISSEEEDTWELVAPSTPIPAVIEFKPVPVTLDDEESWSSRFANDAKVDWSFKSATGRK